MKEIDTQLGKNDWRLRKGSILKLILLIKTEMTDPSLIEFGDKKIFLENREVVLKGVLKFHFYEV